MTYRGEALALGLLAIVAGWLSRAPREPLAHAAYLCAPVHALVATAARLEAAFSDRGLVVPPEQAWVPEVPRDCVRMVMRLSGDAGGD
jgi:hypothetical protein